MTRAHRLAAALIAMLCAACAHAPGPPGSPGATATPGVDESTRALWRFDETSGGKLVDVGPSRLSGTLGIDTQPEYGRFGNARTFRRSVNSFALVPAATAMDLGSEWAIEAWVWVNEYGLSEVSAIAARWTPAANEQSWMLGLTGRSVSSFPFASTKPDWFVTLVARRPLGLVVFVLQPAEASEPRAFFSSRRIDRERWTHIAVTHDGTVLRIYVDGRLDAQYARPGAVRPSVAPLVIGNAFDPRWLTEARGSLSVPDEAGAFPFYAFEGRIDELRISSAARDFGGTR